MQIEKWVTVNNKGVAKMWAKKPSILPEEVLILVRIDIPDEMFETPPAVADISVPVIESRRVRAVVETDPDKMDLYH